MISRARSFFLGFLLCGFVFSIVTDVAPDRFAQLLVIFTGMTVSAIGTRMFYLWREKGKFVLPRWTILPGFILGGIFVNLWPWSSHAQGTVALGGLIIILSGVAAFLLWGQTDKQDKGYSKNWREQVNVIFIRNFLLGFTIAGYVFEVFTNPTADTLQTTFLVFAGGVVLISNALRIRESCGRVGLDTLPGWKTILGIIFGVFFFSNFPWGTPGEKMGLGVILMLIAGFTTIVLWDDTDWSRLGVPT